MTAADAMQKLRSFIVNRARHAKDRDAAFEALFAIAEENVALRADCGTLAKLASETPQFSNPLVVWEAQAIRDRYLEAAAPAGATTNSAFTGSSLGVSAS